MRRRHHRRRHHPGRHGDDGQARDPRRRGFRPRRLSARCRGAADRRAGRLRGRGRPSDRRGRGDRRRATARSTSRVSQNEAERELFWAGRKAAFPAVGRISPDYYCMDGTIPRKALPTCWRGCGEMSEQYGLRVANVFHAGDGNLHPLILYDANKPGELERAEEFGADILRLCVEVGGVLTGEHGVGVEKRDLMDTMFNEIDLAQQQRLKCAFDPTACSIPARCFRSSTAAPNSAACMSIAGQVPLPRPAAVLSRRPGSHGVVPRRAMPSRLREVVGLGRGGGAAARDRRRRLEAGARPAAASRACARRVRRCPASREYEPRELVLTAGGGDAARRDRSRARREQADAGLRAARLARAARHASEHARRSAGSSPAISPGRAGSRRARRATICSASAASTAAARSSRPAARWSRTSPATICAS